ncbi:MAG: hypothetical protein H0V92_00130, partial [Pseudonocardiales bacterium]|nr:hypothetical protein [Pseudonocardiales bacterium]
MLAAFGMAARRWYLLIPLVLVSIGVSWLAYTQMPATYTASVVHQVQAPTPHEPKPSGRRGLILAPPPPPADPHAEATAAAAQLVESVHPQHPVGAAPGHATAQPVTVQLRPGPSSVTVRATADSAGHARDAVAAASTQLTERLREINDEQRILPADRMTLETVVPLVVQGPIRTVGRKVFVATLGFCLGLSVVLAAAVERSARRRRVLLADADEAGAEAGESLPVQGAPEIEWLPAAERAVGAAEIPPARDPLESAQRIVVEPAAEAITAVIPTVVDLAGPAPVRAPGRQRTAAATRAAAARPDADP